MGDARREEETLLDGCAEDAVRQGDFATLRRQMARQRFPDAFRVLLSSGVRKIIGGEVEGQRPSDWITSRKVWDPNSWGLNADLSSGEKLIHILWQDLVARVTRRLDEIFSRLVLPSEGSITCWFGGNELCIIARYRRSSGGAVELRPIAAVENPEGLFDVYSLLAASSQEQRNLLKRAAICTDKLVYQRGVLVHVNRQTDDVFGPSIDTIILAEQVVKWLYLNSSNERLRALEIGPGSGMLSCMMAQDDNVESLYSIDINPSAIGCTLRNLSINGSDLDSQRPVMRIRAESYDANELGAPFDLVVCNPPYIPKSGDHATSVCDAYQRATGGLGLCEQLLSDLDRLIGETGDLLIMASSLSRADIEKMVPARFQSMPAFQGKGVRVSLDVDTLWEDEKWRESLLEEGRIERSADGVLCHYLQPLAIAHKRE